MLEGSANRVRKTALMRGTLGAGSLVQTNRLTRDLLNSVWPAEDLPRPRRCGGNRFYDAYTFENGDTNACISITLQASCDLFSVAYTNAYDPPTTA